MFVVKRIGTQEPINFGKVQKRIQWMKEEPYNLEHVNDVELSQMVIQNLHNGIHTSEIDNYASNLAASLSTNHTDYALLAGRIFANNFHKNTLNSFRDKIALLYMRKDSKGVVCPLITDEFYKFVKKNHVEIDKVIDYSRDYLIDFFGFKTLEKGYLLKIDNKPVERPQDMFMRVAVQLHMNTDKDIDVVLKLIFTCYDNMSQKYYTHATPTLFNAGTVKGNYSSCFDENSLVDTLEGPKKIKNIKIGDEVVTHMGNVKKVVQVHKNLLGDRKLFKCDIFKSEPLVVTGNHKLWTFTKSTDSIQWKSVDELDRDDYISIPNYDGELDSDVIDIQRILGNSQRDNQKIIYIDKKCNTNYSRIEGAKGYIGTSINSTIKVDNDFMKFLGIWYGDGHIMRYTHKNGERIIRGIGITIHSDNTKLIEFCKNFGTKLGLEHICVHTMKSQNVIQVLFNNSVIGYLFNSLYGSGFNGKRLNPRIYKYSTELILHFLSGLITTDGCVSKQGVISLCMANEILMQEIYTLCRLHNLEVTRVKAVKERQLTRTPAFVMHLTNIRSSITDIWKTYKDDRIDRLTSKQPINSQFTSIVRNGFKFLKFDKKTKISDNIPEFVYTLGIEDDHSYSIAGIIAQNCYLIGSEDSREGILKTLDDSTQISKWSGGIGFHVSMWRASGSLIRGTNGDSSGIIPFLRLFNDGARAFNQGGKRMGSFAAYLEPHHPDIMNFLQLRRNSGDENLRCRDLFLALWISDLFMERVEADQSWSTFCPDECPNLNKCWGGEYRELYLKYESEGLSRRSYPAREIWKAVFESQKESGMPYLLYKDSANRNSMQKNIGTIASSNLCVAGDTNILTRDGYRPIKKLSQSVPPVHDIWNGTEFTKATFAQTGENKKLLHITCLDTTFLKCTPEHRFILPCGWRDMDEEIVEAKDLKVGMELILYNSDTQLTKLVPIVEISSSVELEDTYCFNEPKQHRGVFNGILTANCAEIMLYSDSTETSVCNLASVCLPQFVEDTHAPSELEQEPLRPLNHEFPVHPVFNYRKLLDIVGELVVNLNNVIDKNWNPVIESARSNFFHRPLGIGVQGLADVFLKFRVAFDSELARELNRKIFETIYYSAVSKSSEMCRIYYKSVVAQIRTTSKPYVHKIFTKEVRAQYPDLKKDESKIVYNTPEEVLKTIGTYPTYLDKGGSPLANGKFHWELFGLSSDKLSGMYDWETLRNHIGTYGVRNSLLVALMPTASTSQIMGSSSCFEPYVANIYTRKTLAGEFIIVNKYLIRDLQNCGIWSDTMKQYLIASNGSVQNIEGIPNHLKEIYKTVWEIKQKSIIDLAVDRQAFVDQSQSMNLYLEDFVFNKFNSMQFYAWKSGLKTGCYYQKTRSAVMPQKFAIDTDIQQKVMEMSMKNDEVVANIYESEDFCLMCSG